MNLRSLALLIAVLAVGLVARCGASPAATDAAGTTSETVELRTYSVPAGYESQVPSMLRAALGGEGMGRVSVGPTGTILVLALPSVQRGVEAFLAELDQAGAPPPGPRPVLLSYWIVLGVAAPQASESRIAGDPALGEVEHALGEIVRAQGPQRFKLLERIQLTSVGDEWAQASGNQVRVRQRATHIGDVVLSDIQINLHGHQLETQVKLQPEQVAVLAQTGVGDWARSSEFRAENVYYIVASRID
jgi:hypothetical protein